MRSTTPLLGYRSFSLVKCKPRLTSYSYTLSLDRTHHEARNIHNDAPNTFKLYLSGLLASQWLEVNNVSLYWQRLGLLYPMPQYQRSSGFRRALQSAQTRTQG